MNPENVSTMTDDELREHFKQHPLEPDHRYTPHIETLRAHVKRDLLAALNNAIHQGQLDLDELVSNITDAGEYAEKILGSGSKPGDHVLGVHGDWVHVSWASLTGGAGTRIYTVPYNTSSPGLESTSCRLARPRLPEAFLLGHDAGSWGWIHPRWRWITDLDNCEE